MAKVYLKYTFVVAALFTGRNAPAERVGHFLCRILGALHCDRLIFLNSLDRLYVCREMAMSCICEETSYVNVCEQNISIMGIASAVEAFVP